MKLGRVLLACATLFVAHLSLAAYPPGGFWKNDASMSPEMAPYTSTDIAAFMPSTRTHFTFPSPYNSEGVRITLPSDCTAAGFSNPCVEHIGANYWQVMSNSTGLPYMYIYVGMLGNLSGGTGMSATLYKYDKDKGTMSRVGLIMNGSIPQSTETWFWSYMHPDSIYMRNASANGIIRYNVVTGTTTTVMDLTSWSGYPAHGNYIYQCNYTMNDTIVACVDETTGTPYVANGCVVYNMQTGVWSWFPNSLVSEPPIHKCQPSADGRYMYINDQASSLPYDSMIADLDEKGRIYNVSTFDGAQGHTAMGYGWAIINDPDATSFKGSGNKVYDLSDPLGTNSNFWLFSIPWASDPGAPEHPMWSNAKPLSERPLSWQYACDSTAHDYNATQYRNWGYVVYCSPFQPSVDPSNHKSLIIAPTMTNDISTGGCGGTTYDNLAWANIDFTGHYIAMTVNLDSTSNCQEILIKIPVGQFAHPPPDVTPPEASVVAPAQAATMTGVETFSAHAWDNEGVSSCQWSIDGTNVKSAVTTSPYSITYNTAALATGPHAVKVTCLDSASNASKNLWGKAQVLVVK